jgi:hypothetical protein
MEKLLDWAVGATGADSARRCCAFQPVEFMNAVSVR